MGRLTFLFERSLEYRAKGYDLVSANMQAQVDWHRKAVASSGQVEIFELAENVLDLDLAIGYKGADDIECPTGQKEA